MPKDGYKTNRANVINCEVIWNDSMEQIHFLSGHCADIDLYPFTATKFAFGNLPWCLNVGLLLMNMQICAEIAIFLYKIWVDGVFSWGNCEVMAWTNAIILATICTEKVRKYRI